MKIIKLAIYLLSASMSISAQEVDVRLNGLDEEIQTLIKMYDAVGLSVAIVKNDSIIYSKGFGYRNIEHKLEMTDETLLCIGSTTKSFSATLLGILETQNRVSLLNKPSYYIPDLQFYNDKMNDLITIQDLLCHRSGIGSVDGSNTFFPTNKNIEFIPRFRYLKPNGEIKNSFLYSNVSFGLAGLIVEVITNTSWEERIQNDIFKPMEMNASVTNIDDMIKSNNFSVGYGLSEGKQVKLLNREFTFSKAEGAIVSSAKDMGNYMITWLNNGRYKEKQVIPENYIFEAITIKNIRPQNSMNTDTYLYGYGYGWFIQSFKGNYNVEHGGNVPGFSCQLAMYPYEKLGIIVLTNQNNSALPYLVEDIITNRMLKLPQQPINEYTVNIAEIGNRVREVNSINNNELIHPLNNYCGTYTNGGYGTIEIFKKGKILHIKFPENSFVLEHQNDETFNMANTIEIPETFSVRFFNLEFHTNLIGNINSLSISFQREPVVFEKE